MEKIFTFIISAIILFFVISVPKAFAQAGCWTASAPNCALACGSCDNQFFAHNAILSAWYSSGGGFNFTSDYQCNNGTWDYLFSDGGGGSNDPFSVWYQSGGPKSLNCGINATITSPTSNPTYATSGSSINLSGTASDDVGVLNVTWSNNRGGSGTAAGTTNWSINGVTLQSGDNIITITARDTEAVSETAADQITVSRNSCTGPVVIPWTDSTITANSSKIRKAHIDELRTWINNRRANAGLAAQTWTDPTITANSTKIRKIHFDEMRTAISQVYTSCGSAAPVFTDPTITANSTKIRKVHLDELRNAVANAP